MVFAFFVVEHKKVPERKTFSMIKLFMNFEESGKFVLKIHSKLFVYGLTK